MPDIPSIAASVPSLKQHLETHRYIYSDQIATSVYLAYHLRKPVLIEGPPGVGKTELAKTTAAMFDLPLIRLQCYEGLDESKTLYEWKYGKQLLYTQVLKQTLWMPWACRSCSGKSLHSPTAPLFPTAGWLRT